MNLLKLLNEKLNIKMAHKAYFDACKGMKEQSKKKAPKFMFHATPALKISK